MRNTKHGSRPNRASGAETNPLIGRIMSTVEVLVVLTILASRFALDVTAKFIRRMLHRETGSGGC